MRWREVPLHPRTPIRLPVLNLAVALWMLGLLNLPFWSALWRAVDGWSADRAAWLLTLPILALVLVWLSLELLTWGRAAKPVLCGLMVAAAALAYFMNRYGIAFDRGMLGNVLGTDAAEVCELLSPGLLVWVLGLGVLPAVVLSRMPLTPRGLLGALVDKAATLTALLGVSALLLTGFFASYASLFRNHRDLRSQLVPINLLAAAHGYARARINAPREFVLAAADAARLSGVEQAGRPLVLVLVVGETTRAASLSLNGYGRPTTPMLAARPDLINFGTAEACGTATATSLPCMFMDVGRAAYADGLAYRRESLLDALQRAGLDVWWIDNNSGCKGVCDRVQVVDAASFASDAGCGVEGCFDEVLLDRLDQRLAAVERDTVIVLHMKGQHGPAYYRRYPPTFERFAPVCSTNALDRCDPASVVNAYDNALVYTDHVLDWAITSLSANSNRADTALMFVSDHGESLGESGIFLHGMPYDFAPPYQKEVPFMAWLPEATLGRLGLDRGCLMQRTASLSHDNLYHSVLGISGVRATVYRAQADVFAACRVATQPATSVDSRKEKT